MGNEGIFKGVAGEWRYGQGVRCLKKFDDPCLRECMRQGTYLNIKLLFLSAFGPTLNISPRFGKTPRRQIPWRHIAVLELYKKAKRKEEEEEKNAIDMENANSAFFCKNIFKKNAPKMLELDLSSKAKISWSYFDWLVNLIDII